MRKEVGSLTVSVGTGMPAFIDRRSGTGSCWPGLPAPVADHAIGSSSRRMAADDE